MAKKKEQEGRLSDSEIKRMIELHTTIRNKMLAVLDDPSSKGQVIIAAVGVYERSELELMRLELMSDTADKQAIRMESLERENASLRHQLEEMKAIYGDPRAKNQMD